MRTDTYYAQTTEFTCGPACLMMAMKMLDPGYVLRREDEFSIWREANSIFMGDGHPGCAPHALGLAAMNRGLDIQLWLWNTDDLFSDWTRKQSHKNIMLMMEGHDKSRAEKEGLSAENRRFGLSDLQLARKEGYVPIVLTADGIEAHWMVITHMDTDTVYVHEPFIDVEENQQLADCVNMPIAQKKFREMIRYGRRDAQAAILVGLRR
ncbi:MAG: hypothetical protein GC134_09215 [Proteobacteria bacterium]|nr:hypothetical protein [Pseudomonadota bacterium]